MYSFGAMLSFTIAHASVIAAAAQAAAGRGAAFRAAPNLRIRGFDWPLFAVFGGLGTGDRLARGRRPVRADALGGPRLARGRRSSSTGVYRRRVVHSAAAGDGARAGARRRAVADASSTGPSSSRSSARARVGGGARRRRAARRRARRDGRRRDRDRGPARRFRSTPSCPRRRTRPTSCSTTRRRSSSATACARSTRLVRARQRRAGDRRGGRRRERRARRPRRAPAGRRGRRAALRRDGRLRAARARRAACWSPPGHRRRPRERQGHASPCSAVLVGLGVAADRAHRRSPASAAVSVSSSAGSSCVAGGLRLYLSRAPLRWPASCRVSRRVLDAAVARLGRLRRDRLLDLLRPRDRRALRARPDALGAARGRLLFLLVALSYAEGTAAIPETGGAAMLRPPRVQRPGRIHDRLGALPRLPDRDRARGALRCRTTSATRSAWERLDRSIRGTSSPRLRRSSAIAVLRLSAGPASTGSRRRRRRRLRLAAAARRASASRFLFSLGRAPHGTSPRRRARPWHAIAFALPLAMLAYTGLETVANLARGGARAGEDAAAQPLRRRSARGRRLRGRRDRRHLRLPGASDGAGR